MKFASETGTGVGRILGRHWAKWSDALAEAGFLPNQMKEAYDKDKLLQLVAELTASLLKFPSITEIKLRSRNDEEFPSHSAVQCRWTQAELLADLILWCQQRDGYEDVLTICQSTTIHSKGGKGVERDHDAVTQSQSGYIYLLKSGKYYKIGLTRSIGRRE